MITTDLNRAEFDGDNSGKVYVFASGGTNIPIRDESHIKVYLATVLQTITTHYTVSFVGTTATVTFVTAPPTGTKNILFIREVPFRQETDLINNSLLEAESLERQLDLVVNQTQQLNDRIDRNFRLSDTLTAANATSTHATLNVTSALRANKSLKFDGSGNLATSTLDADELVTLATEQVTLATAQVALAAIQVGLAEDEKDDAVVAKLAAEAAETAAEGILDNFDDRYLGVKSSDPTLDNDSNALVDGAIYYDSTNDYIKVYDSSLTPKWRQITTTVANQTNIDILTTKYDGSTSAGSGTNLNIAQVNTAALSIANVNNFADLYQIDDFTTVPTKDGGGVDALAKGDLAFDTTLNALRVYNGTAWSTGVNTTEGVIVTQEYTANGSLTHFALAHDQGMEIVYLNGVKLLAGDASSNNDFFSVSGGSSTTYVGDGNAATHIYFHSAPANTHLISFVAWGASANTLAVAKTGGTFSGAVTFSAVSTFSAVPIFTAGITSPVINTGVSGSAILDSDTMSGASATTLSSSESIKAYVDTTTSASSPATITPSNSSPFINQHTTKVIQTADGAITFYDPAHTGGILRAELTNVSWSTGNTTNVTVVTVTGSGSGAKCRVNNSPFYANFEVSVHGNSTHGSGYKVGDTFQLSSGAATGVVTAITGANVLEINPNNNTYTDNPTNSVRVAYNLEVGGSVGIGTDSPNGNAVLDLTSTTKAFMPPRMTTTQRDAVSSPTAGMVIYNTTTNVLNFYNGSSWSAV